MKTINTNKVYYFRATQNIESDLERNWSSWNFGQGGITTEELESIIEKIENNEEVELSISMMDEFIEAGSSVESDWINGKKHYFINNDIEIAELYENYWVLIDNINAEDGLSVVELNSVNFNDMIKECEELSNSAVGDGDSISANDVTIFYKTDAFVILESK